MPEAMPDPEFPDGEMYFLGEYCHDGMGRYINLYYGSFAALFADAGDEELYDELYTTSSPWPASGDWRSGTRSSWRSFGRSIGSSRDSPVL